VISLTVLDLLRLGVGMTCLVGKARSIIMLERVEMPT